MLGSPAGRVALRLSGSIIGSCYVCMYLWLLWVDGAQAFHVQLSLSFSTAIDRGPRALRRHQTSLSVSPGPRPGPDLLLAHTHTGSACQWCVNNTCVLQPTGALGLPDFVHSAPSSHPDCLSRSVTASRLALALGIS